MALVGALVLVLLSQGDGVKQLSMVVYGVALVLLFALSAAYHIGSWSPPVRTALRRFDHSNIFLLIAGTYTPVAVNALDGGQRVQVLTAVWVPS